MLLPSTSGVPRPSSQCQEARAAGDPHGDRHDRRLHGGMDAVRSVFHTGHSSSDHRPRPQTGFRPGLLLQDSRRLQPHHLRLHEQTGKPTVLTRVGVGGVNLTASTSNGLRDSSIHVCSRVSNGPDSLASRPPCPQTGPLLYTPFKWVTRCPPAATPAGCKLGRLTQISHRSNWSTWSYRSQPIASPHPWGTYVRWREMHYSCVVTTTSASAGQRGRNILKYQFITFTGV